MVRGLLQSQHKFQPNSNKRRSKSIAHLVFYYMPIASRLDSESPVDEFAQVYRHFPNTLLISCMSVMARQDDGENS